MRNRSNSGFTLLEVMMATMLLAVGSVSIIMVLTSAAAYATQRAEAQKITQVLEEARSYAQARVNGFDPVQAKETGRKAPGDEEGKIPMVESGLYANYGFKIAFSPLDPAVPERGFDALISVHTNRVEEALRVESMVVAANLIPPEEFATSFTYEEERKGEDDTSVKETE